MRCYSLGCLGVIVQKIRRICDRLLQVLELCAVPADMSSFSCFLGQSGLSRQTRTGGVQNFDQSFLVKVSKRVHCMYKHSLWGVEGPLHEQDPGHDHGEHVLHPRRHLVGGRRSEVDVQHPHLRVGNANKFISKWREMGNLI